MHPEAVLLCFRIAAVGAFTEHVGSRQVSRDVDAILMASGNDLFQVLPILFFVLNRPAAAPRYPDPVELCLLEQAEHLLELTVIDVGQHVLLFSAEVATPPGSLGLPALDLSAVQPD